MRDSSLVRALKCVVVGGDSSWIASIERLLRVRSCRCHTLAFLDPLAGLDFVVRNPADLIVVDLFMPEVHGLFFVEAVRQFGLTLPVILVSADGLIAAEALESGASAFLSKAAVETELVPTFKRLVFSPHVRLA